MILTNAGYYRNPTLYNDQVVFICEDDLWRVPLSGGKADRLTNLRSEIEQPVFSPDGQWLAFVAREEGDADLYLMPSEGGTIMRLTYLDAPMGMCAWSLNGQWLYFRSGHRTVHGYGDYQIMRVHRDGGAVYPLEFGPTVSIQFDVESGRVVLARNAVNNSYWKRYRGGMVGEIWVAESEEGPFQRILQNLGGNPVNPFFLNQRLYFLSDHEQVGNLYSCQLDGTEVRRETNHQTYFVRHAVTDGQNVVFQSGGELYHFDPVQRKERQIEVQWRSPRVQLQRKMFPGSDYLEDVALHPKGHSLAVISRGKLFAMPLWEKAVAQYGQRQAVRYRLLTWLADERLAAISDSEAEETLVVFKPKPSPEPQLRLALPEGRVQSVVKSPTKPQLALTTSRLKLYLMDLDSQTCQQIDASPIREITDVVFSRDGRWLAYVKHLHLERTAIFLMNLDSGQVIQATDPIRYDFQPAFDPEGRYLYFLSSRNYLPVPDSVQTAVSFTRSVKPYLITLKQDLMNPFIPEPKAPGEVDEDEEEVDEGKSEAKQESSAETLADPKLTAQQASGARVDLAAKSKAEIVPEQSTEEDEPTQVLVDEAGILQRVVEFPVPEGNYSQIVGIEDKVLFTEWAENTDKNEECRHRNQHLLWCYDFQKLEVEQLTDDVDYFEVNPEGTTLLYESGQRVRVVEAGVSLPEDSSSKGPSRKSGWINLDRIRVMIDYRQEWRQMFRETWRLQREFFWRPDLGGIDWDGMFERYACLLDRLSTRAELSDLIWEMQGELGTSHAYEIGGDYEPSPYYAVAKLGADIGFDIEHKRYFFERIHQGDVWKKGEFSPLCEPGLNVEQGSWLLEVGGVEVGEQAHPGEFLLDQAGKEVILTIQDPQRNHPPREIVISTLFSEQEVRYREWVKQNLAFVENASAGRVGYLHLPDMDDHGIAEFYRAFLAQTHKHGLVIDVRNNAGGMVSPLILEKLTNRHLGFDIPRWGQAESYPYHTLRGPLVCVCNQFTGSDGDMFCHAFKVLKLGPLVGKRTWGGVVGIDSRYHLVDGTLTTQPQYSAWFHDVKWSLENYGVEPDIEVEYSPDDYRKGIDPQLERAVAEVLRQLENMEIPEPIVHLNGK